MFGEHFVVYGVKAILASINKRVTVTSSTINEKRIVIKSVLGDLNMDISEPIDKNSPLMPFIFLATKFIERFNHDGGIEIKIDSEIPYGVGLGSSSACCVAAAASISGLFTKLSKEEVLKLAIDAERTIFRDTSGADCTVSTFGGLIAYDKKNGFKKLDSRPDFNLVIVNSKQIHFTSEIVANVKKFRDENQQEFKVICEKEEKLVEKVIMSLEKNDLNIIGQLMTENQKYLEKIGVSNEKLEKIIRTANITAYGSKLTGAGAGGCVFALTGEKNKEQTINNLRAIDSECFSVKIDYRGLDT